MSTKELFKQIHDAIILDLKEEKYLPLSSISQILAYDFVMFNIVFSS